jgi:hypothetical protein
VDDAPPKPSELLPPDRNFQITLAERVRAQEGLPSFVRRKREIEDRLAAALAELRALAAGGAGRLELSRKAQALDLERLNLLIEHHNRYYPIEAQLRIDPRTGGSLDGDGAFKPLPPVTPELLLALFDGKAK